MHLENEKLPVDSQTLIQRAALVQQQGAHGIGRSAQVQIDVHRKNHFIVA